MLIHDHSREGKDERQIGPIKNVLVAMRKDQTYRETKLRLLHKLVGLDMLERGYSEEPDEEWGDDDWGIKEELDEHARNNGYARDTGYHVYSSKDEVIKRIVNGQAISCFVIRGDGDREAQEVYVAFSDGDKRSSGTISYLTVLYDTSELHMQESGVHFCHFRCKRDASRHAIVTKTSRGELRAKNLDYALMLPYIDNHADKFHQQFTLVYHDWEVLLCTDSEETKGKAVVERRVFQRILDQIHYSANL